MKKLFILASLLAGVMLISWGCRHGSGETAVPPPPVPPVVLNQPAEQENTPSPAPEEARPQPTETEQPKQVEPNITAPVPEPNEKPAVIETPEPEPAESNLPETKPAEAEKTSPDKLCKMDSEFLNKYVDKDGFVDYRTLIRKKPELLDLLDSFKAVSRQEYNSWSQDDKIAFWINAYNLELTKIILDNYPIQSSRMLRLFWPPNSIRHIKGVWDEKKFILLGEEFTLKQVEERFFVNEFGDPMVFFAISYASVSGPPLENKAYCGPDLSAQLDEQTKRFLAGPHAIKIDRQNQVVYLSSIFKSTWHGNSFLSKYGTDLKFKQQEPDVRAVLNFLIKYLPPQDVDYLETGDYTVEYLGYDWAINERGGQ
jgi:hypothetical protein